MRVKSSAVSFSATRVQTLAGWSSFESAANPMAPKDCCRPQNRFPARTTSTASASSATSSGLLAAHRGPQITLSRTHPNLVRKLFALEVPEIADGSVEIINVAREAGHRSKIAVASRVQGLNAKGACIGPMGQRVRNVMSELAGEKIDIIDFDEDPATFVGNALSPSKVVSVTVVDPEARAARVIVPDFQLSLAIGKEGQNARLAARLTGWRIDIRSDAAPVGDASDRPATSNG